MSGPRRDTFQRPKRSRDWSETVAIIGLLAVSGVCFGFLAWIVGGAL